MQALPNLITLRFSLITRAFNDYKKQKSEILKYIFKQRLQLYLGKRLHLKPSDTCG